MCKVYGIHHTQVYKLPNRKKIKTSLDSLVIEEGKRNFIVKVHKKYESMLLSEKYILIDIGYYKGIEVLKVQIKYVDDVVAPTVAHRAMLLCKMTQNQLLSIKLSL